MIEVQMPRDCFCADAGAGAHAGALARPRKGAGDEIFIGQRCSALRFSLEQKSAGRTQEAIDTYRGEKRI